MDDQIDINLQLDSSTTTTTTIHETWVGHDTSHFWVERERESIPLLSVDNKKEKLWTNSGQLMLSPL